MRRLAGFDYASARAYFVTVVTMERLPVFDNPVLKGIAEEAWSWLGEHFVDVVIDEFVLMPNHLHGVLIINGREIGEPATGLAGSVDSSRVAASREKQPRRKPLGQLIGAFKTRSTSEINAVRGTLGEQLWQSNFYDRVVRSDYELDRIRKYIADNPAMWEQDPENPAVSVDRSRFGDTVLFGASPEKHLHT